MELPPAPAGSPAAPPLGEAPPDALPDEAGDVGAAGAPATKFGCVMTNGMVVVVAGMVGMGEPLTSTGREVTTTEPLVLDVVLVPVGATTVTPASAASTALGGPVKVTAPLGEVDAVTPTGRDDGTRRTTEGVSVTVTLGTTRGVDV